MARQRADRPTIQQVDVDRGAACTDCRRPFRLGERYAERLVGFIGDTPLTEVICLSCGYADSDV